MTEMTDELLARIAERAANPKRRYMTAAEDEARVELPIDEIRRREDAWHLQIQERAREAALRDGMTAEEFDRNVKENKQIQEKFGHSHSDMWDMMHAQMRAWGQELPTTMSFVETAEHIGASTQRPGAKPLSAPPNGADWTKLEQVIGNPAPEDLKRLYSISDGGFGPGFTGLNSVQEIIYQYEDFRRRGPDYCGTVEYPASFLPIAGEMLDYHYDLHTGRIISSNSEWDNCGLDKEGIYDVAYQSLAAMMEDWLERS